MNMWIVDIVQALLELQCPDSPPDNSLVLRGSSFSPIVAAFMTQGYWAQSDVLEKLLYTDFSLWAPLVYVIAVIGGLIGVAIGSPPRNYMWFFMGPAIYSWLIGTGSPVKGVRWALPCVTDPGTLLRFQQKVWELSEVGLANNEKALRQVGINYISKSAPPDGASLNRFAWVSLAFIQYEELLSSTILGMSRWLGLYSMQAGNGGTNTNIPELPAISSTLPAGVIWNLYADKKWEALQEITMASVDNEQFRDVFSQFFVLCGDPLQETFRAESLMAAASTGGRRLPRSAIICGPNDGNCGRFDRSYNQASTILSSHRVEMPSNLGNLLRTVLADAQEAWPGSSLEEALSYAAIDCQYYLFLLMQVLRLEAAFKLHGLYHSIAPELLPDVGILPDKDDRFKVLVSSLFYGWDIRKDRTWSGPFNVSNDGTLLTLEERQEFAYNLILLHLFRNEYKLVKEIKPIRMTNSQKNQENSELALKTTGSVNKFSEFYTWSLMLPYVQGTLLYFLAIAYPIACILIVVPGMHKSLFTWMSFWAWAKLWDLGFAVVKSLERSVWAMTAQGGNVKYLSDRIVEVGKQVGKAEWVACSAASDPMCPIPLFALTSGGGDPTILRYAPPPPPDFNGPPGPEYSDYFDAVTRAWFLFDQSLLMSKALNLDLANSYYIYIMAGLYMAVPAVTGQIVLGARAGAASMVNSMIGGAASEAGRAASSGVQGDMSMKLRSNASTLSQASEAKHMGKQGLAGQALGYSVKQLEEGRAGSEAQAASGAIGKIVGQNQNQMAMREGAARHAQAVGQFGKGVASPAIGRGVYGEQGATGGGGGSGGAGAGTWGQVGGQTLGNAIDTGINERLAASNMAGASDFYGAANKYAQQQAGLDIRAMQANANASQLGVAQSNMGKYADFSAKEAAWNDRNAFAMQVGGWSAALGIQTGNVDPGSKPTDMVGFAMAGRLRTADGANAAGNSAWYVDWNKNGAKGGYRGATNDITDGLTSNYGAGAVESAYHGWTTTEAASAVLGGSPAFQAGGGSLIKSDDPNGGVNRMISKSEPPPS